MTTRGYDTDVVLWAEDQADLLRRRAAGELVNDAELDWLNIAEEIEDLGRSQRRELGSRIAEILDHLIKLEVSSADGPRRGWRASVRKQRDEIERILGDAPSLRRTVPEVIAKELPAAKRRVLSELADYAEVPRATAGPVAYLEDQVLGDWFPD